MGRRRRSGPGWDVPVRVVADAPDAPRGMGQRAGRMLATLDVTLPGVAGVALTVSARDGLPVLTDVAPLRHVPAGAAPLGDVLDGLRDEDGAVPVLVVGTPFTRDVLTALAAVPLGERRTYAELAAAAGAPRAVRAAASVMARNRAPLVLPCHRIVPAAGGSGRYGWGSAAKDALLAAEVAA